MSRVIDLRIENELSADLIRILFHETKRHSGRAGSSPPVCRGLTTGRKESSGDSEADGRSRVVSETLEESPLEGRREGLGGQASACRSPRLSDEQRRELTEILCRGAMAAGYRTELWTVKRIAQVIERHFGVKFHPGHVWKVLRRVD